MENYLIPKGKLKELIDHLLKEQEVIAPLLKKGTILFRRIRRGEEVVFQYTNSVSPPKELFFPQTEGILKFKVSRKGVYLEDLLEEGKTWILWGIRPCDIQSLKIMDNIFNGEYQDRFYLKKREKAILISITCSHPLSTCFCTSLGFAPSTKEGTDLHLTELSQGYLVEVVSAKGERLVDGCKGFFQLANEREIEEKEKVARLAEEEIKTRVDLKDAPYTLAQIFEDRCWEELSFSCIGCGICTFLCPTCHCFDLSDEDLGFSGKRVRTWDSCQFSDFTQMASGHNPRPTKKHRFRQRIYHKFKYFVDNLGIMSCVGCGRCIRFCPVKIDLRKILFLIGGVRSGEYLSTLSYGSKRD